MLGSAPAYTRRPCRASSSYLLESGGSSIVLDLGQGSFAELASRRDPERLGGILVSHLHADHLVDLVPLRHYLLYEADGSRVPLRGPSELRSRFDAFQAEEGFLDVLPGEPLAPGAFELAGFAIEARHVTHIPDSYAFRVALGGEDGPGVVYSGDCGRWQDLVPLVRPGDTFVCEAAMGAAEPIPAIHLTAAEAARAAAEGRAGRLVLTHVLDRADERRALEIASQEFDREVLLAEPGLGLDV